MQQRLSRLAGSGEIRPEALQHRMRSPVGLLAEDQQRGQQQGRTLLGDRGVVDTPHRTRRHRIAADPVGAVKRHALEATVVPQRVFHQVEVERPAAGVCRGDLQHRLGERHGRRPFRVGLLLKHNRPADRLDRIVF